MMKTEMTEITDRLTLVVLDIRVWSGRKKLRAEDLHLADGAIPPEELVSLGSKRVCDPEHLKGFNRLKQSAERACLRIGTRFLGGFAVPKELTRNLATELDQIKSTFDVEIQTFISCYDWELERWISTLPSFESAIRRAVEPVTSVANRLHFGYQMVEIKPAVEPGTLAEEVNKLGNGVFTEVEQMARDLATSFEGKDRLHRRALGTFSRIREKLVCLSFIDDRIQPVVDSIDSWLRRLPASIPIEGSLFNEGFGLALLLGDAERMARHGSGRLSHIQPPAPSYHSVDDKVNNAMDEEINQMIDEDDEFEEPLPDSYEPEPATPQAPQTMPSFFF